MKPLQLENISPKLYTKGVSGPSSIIADPLYAALILTILVLIIVTYVLQNMSIANKQYIKMFVYVFVSCCFLLTLHHSFHVSCIKSDFQDTGIQNTYNSIENIRSSGVLDTVPVEIAYSNSKAIGNYEIPDTSERTPDIPIPEMETPEVIGLL